MTTRTTPARVLYCESSADGTIGGSHYCLLHLLEHLDRSRFEPLTVFYEPHALLPRFEAASETIVHPKDAPVHWQGGGGLLPMLGRGVNFAKFMGVVAGHVSFMRRHRIDLLHLNNSITRHQDWMLAARLAGIPCIVHERGLSDSYTARDKAYASRVQLIVPMSAWIRDHMIARGVDGANIRVMYDGLDPALVKVTTDAAAMRAAWDVPADARVVGIVGNIRPWKGQETVVKAVIEAARRFPDLVCFFVGATTPADEAYLAGMKALLSAAGLEHRVRFTGYQKDVPNFINMMEVLIHASVAPEPFGMVVLEGMAQRKPVIGSRAGGPVEMIVEGETGFTFPPGDAGELAARLADLLGDPARAQRMGAAGYDRLTNEFTMSHYMDNIHETYRAILGHRPVPAGIGLPAGSTGPARRPA
jgi:glycosyltransferase involved in cell wall biosynthesis